MRKLGMIGGMSWVSARVYLEQISRMVQKRTTPRTTAPLIIETFDFFPLQDEPDAAAWDQTTERLIASAKRVEAAGAEGIVICANSMHRAYDDVLAAVSIPILHVADCIGERMAQDKVSNAALIGRKSVMIESYFRQRIVAHNIDLMPPVMENVELIERIIYDELMVGKASRDAERSLKTIITQKEQRGATSIILACTELELVVDIDANVLPIYDSTRIHCEAAVNWMMDNS